MPEGENATSCTQPPLGLENSPQMVPKGSFSPQAVGSGLEVQPEFHGQSATAKTPHSLGIHTLDERGEDVCLRVGSTGREKHVVRVPVQAEDGGPDGLLDVFRDPPVVLLVKVADGDSP